MTTLDAFLRPSAHRGLHDAQAGIIENTWPAFEAAIANGHGIECDVQRTRDDQSIVFHDATLARLTDRTDHIHTLTADALTAVPYKNSPETILTLDTMLRRIDGRVPVLVEIKHDWSPPRATWIAALCNTVSNAKGPIALMSFDPDIMAMIKATHPQILRGLVSGIYRKPDRAPWWPETIDERRAQDLTNLSAIDTVQPDFIAYHVEDLRHDAAIRARQQLALPVLTWTVCNQQHWALCHAYADGAIFEGPVPQRE